MKGERQLKALMKKQRKLIVEADEKERVKLIGFAVGFLNGMRISNAITKEQYEDEYTKLQDCVTKDGLSKRREKVLPPTKVTEPI